MIKNIFSDESNDNQILREFNNNDLNKIIKDRELKIIFLKAIILGIEYGSNKDALKYKINIEKQIQEFSESLIKDQDTLKKINTKKVSFKEDSNKTSENINECKNSMNSFSEPVIKSLDENNDSADNFSIKKYQNIILNLVDSKNNTIKLIENLSNTNYRSNYSKISFLKNNLNIINHEIDKNKIILIREINNKKLLNNLNR